MKFCSYNDALDYLYTLRTFGTKLGLENIRFLLDELGKPDECCDYIHIAGSNGKGSTAAFLSSILREAGLKVGLFTSPHLVRFTERIQINGEEIPEKDVVNLLDKTLNISEKMESDGLHRHPTFFEIITAVAAKYFADQKCDVVIWETGMGGRLDATNSVKPVVSIITNISLDHIKWLGDTILKIAAEKAGIIKNKIPVFTAETNSDVLNLFSAVAVKNNTKIKNICDFDFCSQLSSSCSYSLSSEKFGINKIKLGLNGKYQSDNAALAVIAATWFLTNIAELSESFSEIISSGLEKAFWPARLQKLSDNPMVYLDCAHNMEGISNLVQSLSEISNNSWIIIFGIVEDKNIKDMLADVLTVAKEIWYIKPTAKRGLSSESFSECVNSLNEKIPVKIFNCSKEVLKQIGNKPDDQFIICGSCYLAGDVLSELQGTKRDLRSDDPLT